MIIWLDHVPNETQATEIKTWIWKEERKYCTESSFAQLAADSEAIVNFTTDSIAVGEKTYQANAFCSRIAGLIACQYNFLHLCLLPVK
ncbi:MAG: hypothetical protein ACLSCV_12330 [Acutalibacteraceae bacterium]